MNERIKELAVAAAPVNSSIPHSEWNIPKEFIERFAQLIVQECCDMMIYNQSIDKDPNWNRALRETSKKIKQHFGVE